MHILNIGNPGQPSIVGSVSIPGAAYGIALKGSYAYVADVETAFVHVINVSNPSQPSIMDSVEVSSDARKLVIAGDFVFVAVDDDTNILDISDPMQVRNLGIVRSNTPRGTDIAISGNYIYIIGSGGLSIVDVSNPSMPMWRNCLF